MLNDPEESQKYSLLKDKSGLIHVSEIGEENPYFWPDQSTMLAELLPLAVKVKIMEMFLQSATSEQISRMLAMKLATENAEDMIKRLTRQYNRARQTQITKEILEIMAGAEALEE